jgi:hypothetical protein
MSGVNPAHRYVIEYVTDPLDLPIQVTYVEQRWSHASDTWQDLGIRVEPIEQTPHHVRAMLDSLVTEIQQPRLL